MLFYSSQLTEIGEDIVMMEKKKKYNKLWADHNWYLFAFFQNAFVEEYEHYVSPWTHHVHSDTW